MLLCLPFAAPLSAQTGHTLPSAPAQAKPDAGQAELTRLALAADAARNSGDPAAVETVNRKLIAQALKTLAGIRVRELSYPQAIELYEASLQIKDDPAIRADLAFVQLSSNRLDDALAQAEKALAADPHLIRARMVQGSVLMLKGNHVAANRALSRVLEDTNDIETAYSVAIIYLSGNRPEDKAHAQAIFAKMAELSGDNGSLHVLFGRAYRDANDMDEAVREFQRAIAIDPTTPHAHYFLGIARLAMNEWKPTPESRTELLKEVENHPDDYLANYMLGFVGFGDRDYAKAEKYLSAATRLNPELPDPWLYLGLNAYAQGDAKTAEENLRKAVALTGNDESRSNYQIRRAYVDLGRILANSGREQEADVFLAKARALQNKIMTDTQHDVAAMVQSAGGGMAATVVPITSQQEKQAGLDGQQSANVFSPVDSSTLARANLTDEQRAAVEQEDKSLHTVLGQSYSDLATSQAMRGQFAAALPNYQAAQRWDDTLPGLARNLGQCAFRLENYEVAVPALKQALAENPDSDPLRAMLGIAYFSMQSYRDAAKTFVPLGVPGAQDPRVGYAWAVSLVRIGELSKASDVLNAYDNGHLDKDVLLLVGQVWTEIRDFARAVATYQRALADDPALPRAHFYLGIAYLRWEHWQEAADAFRVELAHSPSDVEAKYNLGFVYLQQSRREEADALFRQVIAEDPKHANAQYQLGKSLLDQGKLAEAIPHLEIAARVSPEKDYVHYQLQAAYRKQNRIADADRELAVYKELKAQARPHLEQAQPANP